MKKGHGHIFSQFAWYGSGKPWSPNLEKQPVSFKEGRRTNSPQSLETPFIKLPDFTRSQQSCSNVLPLCLKLSLCLFLSSYLLYDDKLTKNFETQSNTDRQFVTGCVNPYFIVKSVHFTRLRQGFIYSRRFTSNSFICGTDCHITA